MPKLACPCGNIISLVGIPAEDGYLLMSERYFDNIPEKMLTSEEVMNKIQLESTQLFLCPKCGKLIVFWDSMEHKPYYYEPFGDSIHIPIRNLTGYEVAAIIQRDRRKEQSSGGKALLNKSRIEMPIQQPDNTWLVYDVAGVAQIFYDVKKQIYRLRPIQGDEICFSDIGSLISWIIVPPEK